MHLKEFETAALAYRTGRLYLLDQRKLPQDEVWLAVDSIDQMVGLIRTLAIRGAPLIGVGAAFALADFAARGANKAAILDAALALRRSRPTAVNLMWAIDKMLETDLSDRELCQQAEAIFDAEVFMSQKMASYGADLIQDGENLLTHCNSGSLATVGIGTALGVIKQAHASGKKIHVWVDETRPLLQGARLTAWELERSNIPYTLICDNMAASIMATKMVDRIFVGADRIARNGDFANKIGTYSLAIAANFHRVPFHVVAPVSTIDFACPSGSQIPIEERVREEVTTFCGISSSPLGCKAYNPSFDVTPHQLVTSFVLDRGVVLSDQLVEAEPLAQLC